ncbi:MAG: NUDIX hydrolase [Lysinibacillus sp.]
MSSKYPIKDKEAGGQVTRIFGKVEKGLDYRIRQGAYAVIFDEDKSMILTVHNSNGAYFLPGGGLEGNEDFHQCLEREVVEETGYTILIGHFIGHAQQYFLSSKNEPLLGDSYFYLAELQGKKQEPVEEDHFVSWIDIDRLESLLFHEHQSWAVRKGLRRKNDLL